MQVILLERIEKLGQMGDVVNVKAGFARNFLLPQQKALRATEENISTFEAQKAMLEAENAKRRDSASTDAEKVEGMFVPLIRQAGDAGQLYGSVNARDIANEISTSGINVDKRQVRLDQPIKALGLYPIRIDLHPEVSVTVTANVARSAEEAAMQEKTGQAVVRTEDGEVEQAAPEEVEAEKIFENPEEETKKLAEQTAETTDAAGTEETSAETVESGESEKDTEKSSS
ncbi:MAG: 50S ribosomal protein L9 [Rhodospirillales bacterium]|jgi:large subunit ribosomal protein L9